MAIVNTVKMVKIRRKNSTLRFFFLSVYFLVWFILYWVTCYCLYPFICTWTKWIWSRDTHIILAAPCQNVSSGICGQRRPRSAYASAQSDQGLHCPLTELLNTTEYVNGEQMPGCYFAHAQADLNTHFAHVRMYFFACSGPYIVDLR